MHPVQTNDPMAETPLISIVLPTYNGATYLAQSIESCLAQTYTNWELIIVDDGSTDKTPEVIEEYLKSDDRIRSIRHSRNCKLPKALNTGFAAATGEYFGWIAGDDCYESLALSTMTEYLESHPKVDVVYADFTTVDAKGNRIATCEVCEPECLAVRNGIGPCRLYRRKVHEELNGYDETLFTVEDYDFFLRAFCRFRLSPIHESLYRFRLHDKALTSTHAQGVSIAKDGVKEKNLPQLRRLNRRLAAECHLSLIDPASARGETARARRHALGALRCDPLYCLRNGRKTISIGLMGPTLTRALVSAKSLCVAKKSRIAGQRPSNPRRNGSAG